MRLKRYRVTCRHRPCRCIVFDGEGSEEKMSIKSMGIGATSAPTAIVRCAVPKYDSQLYISNASNDLQQLKSEPLILFFANVDPDIYQLVASTNPTLKMAFDLAKRVVEVGRHD